MSVTWYHNARPLRASARVRLLPDGGLEIREARAADVGRYTCEVRKERERGRYKCKVRKGRERGGGARVR